MFESHAIMKFICGYKKLPDHWYPTSPQRDLILQAKMDQYLDWHHANIRMGAGGFLFRKFFSGLMDKNGVYSSKESIDESWKILNRSLHQIQRIWLRKDRGHKFMFSDKPSIADLSLACELTQLESINYPLHKYPEINSWFYEHMMSVKEFKAVHLEGSKKVTKVIKMLAERLNDAKM